MVAWAENKKMQDKNTSLLGVMDEHYQKKVTENRKYIKALAEILS